MIGSMRREPCGGARHLTRTQMIVGPVLRRRLSASAPAISVEFLFARDFKINIRLWGQEIVHFGMVDDVLTEFGRQFQLPLGEFLRFDH